MVQLKKQFPTKQLTAAPGERAVIGQISTTEIDRDGDVVLPSGVDLTNFWKIPTVLLVHDNQRLPVAKVPRDGIRRLSDSLEAKAIFLKRPPSLPANQEWQPDTLLDLFRMGAPLGFSVGFRIKDARVPTEKDLSRFGTKARRIITEWELLEFSVVPIPSNPSALATAVSKCHRPVGDFTRRALSLPGAPIIRQKPPFGRRIRVGITDSAPRISID